MYIGNLNFNRGLHLIIQYIIIKLYVNLIKGDIDFE